jgi:hypothetical protein
MSDRFVFNNIDLPLWDHPYNTTILNERAIEIPIVMRFLSQISGARGLEVGNVFSHYFPDVLTDRRIVDKYEKTDGVENIDVFDIRGEYDYIFAISTLEHVRWDPPEERQLDGAGYAIDHLFGLLARGGKMMVTVPFGSNPGLDYGILKGDFKTERETVMMRVGGLWSENPTSHRWECKGSSWHQADSIWWERYGKSTPWADAVWIGEFAT